MCDNTKTKSVHSETLFHICNNLETVKSILSDKAFKPSFTREVVNVNDVNTPYYWVPMVSFCDFKIYELDLHFQKYGHFGIGLSKDWGISKRLNPVIYLSQDCIIFGEIRKAIIGIYDVHNNLAETHHNNKCEILYNSLQGHLQTILKIYGYTKNYQGDLERDGKITRNFRFADDKEWRYVPEIDDVHASFRGCDLVNPTTKQKKAKKAELNKAINENHWLKFEYSDIKFIVVSNNDESTQLIEFIQNLFIEQKNKLFLISKILIIEDIEL